jgi:hypothetical protein
MSPQKKFGIFYSRAAASSIAAESLFVCGCKIIKYSWRPKFTGLMTLSLNLVQIIRPSKRKSVLSRQRQSLSLLPSLIWRRPEFIIPFKYRYRIFEINENQNCDLHLMHDERNSYWFSEAASRNSFRYSIDKFNNALAVFRNPNLDKFVVQTKIASTPVDLGSYRTQDDSNEEELVGSWRFTSLHSRKNFEVSLSPLHRFAKASNNQMVKSALFIDANLNTYHFLSESLRPLILAIEIGVKIDNIIVRADLPMQYYEMINIIDPTVTILKMDVGESRVVENFYFGNLSQNLADSDRNFYSPDGLKLFKESDEMKCWNYIKSRFGTDKSTERIVYVSRNRLDSRGIFNFKKLENKLSLQGVQVVNSSQGFSQYQWKHFSEAKTFCSSDGAGMINMIFLEKNSKVVELYFKESGWRNLALSLGMQYESIRLKSIGIGRLRTILDNYYISREQMSKLLNSLSMGLNK